MESGILVKCVLLDIYIRIHLLLRQVVNKFTALYRIDVKPFIYAIASLASIFTP